jgi:hypothetical protein
VTEGGDGSPWKRIGRWLAAAVGRTDRATEAEAQANGVEQSPAPSEAAASADAGVAAMNAEASALHDQEQAGAAISDVSHRETVQAEPRGVPGLEDPHVPASLEPSSQPVPSLDGEQPAATEDSSTEWRVIGASVRGAAHERSGLPNQDAIDWEPKSPDTLPVILAVSDGHGSARSFRSDQGSRFAVAAAIEAIGRLIAGQPDLANHSAIKRTAQEALPLDMVRTWDAFVEGALLDNPLSESELGHLEPAARRAVESNPRLAFGATLLAVLVAPSFILYLQLGDGDILAVSQTGDVERPLPRDPRLFANETTSLSSEQAWRNMGTAFQTLAGSPPALIVLSTDGYANSFRNEEEFRKIGPDLLSLLRSDGMASVSESLPAWLEEATRAGSGDDITVGILCRTDALKVSTPVSEPTDVMP